MQKNNFLLYLLMNFAFLIYSIYPVLGKIASKYNYNSFNFLFIYCLIIFVLFIYAILWQKILTYLSLSTAIANKSVIIIWGMVFDYFIFNMPLTINKIAGALIILAGIILLSFEEKE